MRRTITFSVSTIAILFVAAACNDDWRRCDYVERHCRTVCDYWCDGWGCYPTCYDQCWDECYVDSSRRDRTPRPSPSPLPDAAVTGGAAADGGAPTGKRVLCSPCESNSDCESGALCILRGGVGSGADAGSDAGVASNAFCGHACAGAGDCPQNFTCTAIGSTRQCLPNNGACQ